MNGIELAEAARAARPGLPVIFMSGYTAVPGRAAADSRDRRAAAVEAVHDAATRARGQCRLRAGAREQ